MRPIDLPPADLETVRRILRDHAPGLEARAFGSRVSWTARDTSDLALVLMTESPLDAGRMAALRAALAGSDLPFRVDVADWAAVSGDFREIIEREYAVISPTATRPTKRRWKRIALGDCIEINDDTYSPRERWSFVNYLDTGSITENRISEIQHLVDGRDKIPARARRKARQGDIVYSTVRPNQRHYGVLRDIPENFLASTGFSVLRGRKGVAFTDFIYWFLARNETVEYLQSVAEQSKAAYPAINPIDIEQLPVDLPPLAEQRAIAEILGALDDKIELNRRMNETLEAMARAIFNDWFVDFGPVRAKTEGRELYLAPEVWRLFPDRIDADTGAPEGWRSGSLGDIAVSEHRAVAPAEIAADTPYIGLEHMPRRSIALSRWGRADQVKTPKLRFDAGEFLFGRLRPYFHKVGVAPFDGICSTTIAVVRPVSQEWSAPVLACISSESFVDFADRSSTGTTMPQTSWKALSRYELAIPPPALAAAFGDAVAPMLDRIVANVRESHALADARDSLLPRLMSGRIPVSNFR